MSLQRSKINIVATAIVITVTAWLAILWVDTKCIDKSVSRNIPLIRTSVIDILADAEEIGYLTDEYTVYLYGTDAVYLEKFDETVFMEFKDSEYDLLAEDLRASDCQYSLDVYHGTLGPASQINSAYLSIRTLSKGRKIHIYISANFSPSEYVFGDDTHWHKSLWKEYKYKRKLFQGIRDLLNI